MLGKALDAFRRRWPLAAKVYLALACVSGAAAYLLASGWVARVEAARPDPGPLVEVVVAASPVPRGATLAPGQVRVETIPSRYAAPGALGEPDDAVGRVATSPLTSGEVVTETRLAPGGSGPLAALVPPGLRAVVVPARVPPGVLEPGDRVDVVATYGGARPYADTVATGLEVVLVLDGDGDGLSPVASEGVSVAVLVDPAQAERLAYAGAFATISVAIAGPDG